MKLSLAFFMLASISLGACQQAAKPESLDDLVKKGLIEVEYVKEGEDDLPEVKISPPDARSERGRALAATEKGSAFLLYSLQPRDYPSAPHTNFKYGSAEHKLEEKRFLEAWYKEKEAYCSGGRCLQLNPVLGKVSVTNEKDIQTLKAALRSALGQVPDYATACIAEYRHAISFVSEGKRYDVLLCYGCGQVSVVIDGEPSGDDQAYVMDSEPDLDRILTAHNVKLAPKGT